MGAAVAGTVQVGASVSAQEFKSAFDAGRAAFRRGEPTTANPHRLERVHPMAPPPDPHQTMLAAVWLRGWQKGVSEVSA